MTQLSARRSNLWPVTRGSRRDDKGSTSAARGRARWGGLVLLWAALALALVGCGDGDATTTSVAGSTAPAVTQTSPATTGATTSVTTSSSPAAAAFAGTTMDGAQVSLASFAGKPLVLVFWASW